VNQDAKTGTPHRCDVLVIRDLLDARSYIAAARRLDSDNLAIPQRQYVDEAEEILTPLDVGYPLLDDTSEIAGVTEMLQRALRWATHAFSPIGSLSTLCPNVNAGHSNQDSFAPKSDRNLSATAQNSGPMASLTRSACDIRH
jgi:hypothetical protein